MYVTRPLSTYQNSVSTPPDAELEGPNTGILVIEDEASERRQFFGLLRDKSVKVPPFPQNKLLELRYSAGVGDSQRTDYFYAMLIPVPNRPLDSNQYYIINSRGRRKGLAYTSSEDEDTGCCCFSVPDTPPQILDPRNPYQQFQITNYIHWGSPHGFLTNSMAPDALPPYFLRHKGWRAYTKTLDNFDSPTQALGLDAALRARLPDLNSASEPVVVGKWYCPFVFIREGEVDVQIKSSPYYEITLQQNWEEIFECHKVDGTKNEVAVDVCVERQAVFVRRVAATERTVVDGVMWFGPMEVGLSMAIVERVKWEQERCGFKWSENEVERVVRKEEFEGKGEWERFKCYVLVERFVLKRMDGSLVLTWEFRHTHQIKTKWE